MSSSPLRAEAYLAPETLAQLSSFELRARMIVEGISSGMHSSPKQGMAGSETVRQAIDAVRSGGKIIGVSWFGAPLDLNIDLLRERSLRYLFPDISTKAHLEHTVRLVASGRVHVKSTITHQLSGIESVPRAFEITANKGKFQAINPAQVIIREDVDHS